MTETVTVSAHCSLCGADFTYEAYPGEIEQGWGPRCYCDNCLALGTESQLDTMVDQETLGREIDRCAECGEDESSCAWCQYYVPAPLGGWTWRLNWPYRRQMALQGFGALIAAVRGGPVFRPRHECRDLACGLVDKNAVHVDH